MATKYEYVIYKGDEIVFSGTAREVRQKYGEGTYNTMISTRNRKAESEGKERLIAEKVLISEIEEESDNVRIKE
ncbi:hypothetical protein IM157_01060 [Staphylococcus epidermidis]|nr:hypothetical protein [Staphylococcus epidermidis]